MEFYEAKYWKGWCDIDSRELGLTFGGYLFGENRSRNATVRMPTHKLVV